jgi:ubiquinone/menaquinone biosynthesis C-methylase UbiE
MCESQVIDHHFSQIAPIYRQIRTTDLEPVLFIAETLKGFPQVNAADIGCGCGRYDLLLFRHLNNLHLTCIDMNEHMLEQVSGYLTSHNITRFKTIKANANDIPLEDNSLDCILTFNAIHHFDFINFVKKSGEVVKRNGLIFIYTRTRSQNGCNIWGQYFPFFCERETRLYELDEMKRWIQSVDSLILETAKTFKYKRNATLKELVEKARSRHYSTFSLYQEDELQKALETFQKNIAREFHDTSRIEWFDENILLVLKRK